MRDARRTVLGRRETQGAERNRAWRDAKRERRRKKGLKTARKALTLASEPSRHWLAQSERRVEPVTAQTAARRQPNISRQEGDRENNREKIFKRNPLGNCLLRRAIHTNDHKNAPQSRKSMEEGKKKERNLGALDVAAEFQKRPGRGRAKGQAPPSDYVCDQGAPRHAPEQTTAGASLAGRCVMSDRDGNSERKEKRNRAQVPLLVVLVRCRARR
jgi:hypothetical protein